MLLFKPLIKGIEKSTISKEIAKIEADPDTAFVIRRPDKMVIVTQDIKKYGKYIICIKYKSNENSNDLIIYNVYLGETEEFQHLHIGDKCERPCFGNINSDIIKYHISKRYHLMFMLIMHFLRSYKKERGGYYESIAEFRNTIKDFKEDMRYLNF